MGIALVSKYLMHISLGFYQRWLGWVEGAMALESGGSELEPSLGHL